MFESRPQEPNANWNFAKVDTPEGFTFDPVAFLAADFLDEEFDLDDDCSGWQEFLSKNLAYVAYGLLEAAKLPDDEQDEQFGREILLESVRRIAAKQPRDRSQASYGSRGDLLESIFWLHFEREDYHTLGIDLRACKGECCQESLHWMNEAFKNPVGYARELAESRQRYMKEN